MWAGLRSHHIHMWAQNLCGEHKLTNVWQWWPSWSWSFRTGCESERQPNGDLWVLVYNGPPFSSLRGESCSGAVPARSVASVQRGWCCCAFCVTSRSFGSQNSWFMTRLWGLCCRWPRVCAHAHFYMHVVLSSKQHVCAEFQLHTRVWKRLMVTVNLRHHKEWRGRVKTVMKSESGGDEATVKAVLKSGSVQTSGSCFWWGSSSDAGI